MDLLNIFFPKKCINCKAFGSYLCSNCFIILDYNVLLICGVCGRQAIGGLTHPSCQSKYSIDGIFASVVYKGIAKRLIYQFKFDPYLRDLRFLLSDLFYDGLIQQESFIKVERTNALLMPVPLSFTRQRERGYNQALILATDLGKKLEIPVKDLVMRKKHTTTQVGKTQTERRQNMKDVFAVIPGLYLSLRDKTIFIVDDVVTSGATMNEIAKILKKAGAENVYGLAFAHGI